MKPIVLALLAVTSLTACSLYQSSDREAFNKPDGHSKVSTTSVNAAGSSLNGSLNDALSADEQSQLQNPCDVLESLNSRQLEFLFDSDHVTFTPYVSRKTSTCLVGNLDVDRSSSQLKSLAAISCSWKPSNGDAVETRNHGLSAQPSEDSLRENGIEVLTTRISTGTRLRLNCEAYVSTPALIAADQSVDEARPLARRFSEFSSWLVRETLTSTLQR